MSKSFTGEGRASADAEAEYRRVMVRARSKSWRRPFRTAAGAGLVLFGIPAIGAAVGGGIHWCQIAFAICVAALALVRP